MCSTVGWDSHPLKPPLLCSRASLAQCMSHPSRSSSGPRFCLSKDTGPDEVHTCFLFETAIITTFVYSKQQGQSIYYLHITHTRGERTIGHGFVFPVHMVLFSIMYVSLDCRWVHDFTLTWVQGGYGTDRPYTMASVEVGSPVKESL